MWIAIIIVSGIVLSTLSASIFDYLSKKGKAHDKELEGKVAELERKVQAMEGRIEEKDGRIGQLESDFSFMSRLIEDKTGK